MTVEEITAAIRRFRDERDWQQFHNPKDMAIAISLEASELLEQFLWIDNCEAQQRAEARQEAVREEIADSSIYLFELADNLGTNLLAAISAETPGRVPAPAHSLHSAKPHPGGFDNGNTRECRCMPGR